MKPGDMKKELAVNHCPKTLWPRGAGSLLIDVYETMPDVARELILLELGNVPGSSATPYLEIALTNQS